MTIISVVRIRQAFRPVFMVSLFFSLFLMNEGQAADNDVIRWLSEDAFARLQIRPQRADAHLLWVPVPVELQETVRGAAAYVDGQKISASAVHLRGQIIAVECAVPLGSTRQEELPLEVYLFKEVKSTSPPADRRPVHLRHIFQKMRTRPFTSSEMMQLMTVLKGFSVGQDLAKFDIQLLPDKLRQSRKNVATILHWSSMIAVDERASLQLGAKVSEAAWFMFIDGKPVASWKEGEIIDGDARIADIETDNVRRLDFFVIREKEEDFPVPMLYQNGKFVDIPPEICFSGSGCEAVRLQFRKDRNIAGYEFKDMRHFYLSETDSFLTVAQLSSLLASDSTEEVSKLQIAESSKLSDDAIQLYSSNIDMLKIKQLHSPVQESENSLTWHHSSNWQSMDALTTRLQIEWLPIVLQAAAPLSFRIKSVIEPNFAPGTAWRIVCQQQDERGNVLEEISYNMIGRVHHQDVKLTLHDNVAKLSLQAQLQSVPVSNKFTVFILPPTASFAKLEPKGRMLFYNGSPAVLRCQPLAQIAVPGKQKKSEPLRVAVVEDFWAGDVAPDADIQPQDWLARSGYTNVEWISCRKKSIMGAAEYLQIFALLDEVLMRDPQVIIWALGQEALSRGKRPEEFCLQLLFLAQVSQGAGALPVFFTLPRLPNIPAAISRQTALLSKELAYKLQIPVVDVYSKTLLSNHSADFTQYFYSYDGKFALQTPNNRGRILLTRLLTEDLLDSHIFDKRKGTSAQK